jgi:hypothetical protein
MKIYVCSRFTHYDDYLFEHFINYYLKLGVDKFFINFNYKFENDKTDFYKFIEDIKKSKYYSYIIYNIGPNDEELYETTNIQMLKNLVTENTNIDEDYIIPADSDEFQEFPHTLYDTIKMMKNDDLTYLHGSTKERISETGEVILLEKDIDIFQQFPKYNNHLFGHPKISIIKAKYFKYIGVGHHYIDINSIKNKDDKNELEKNKLLTVTNHFRWNLQGKKRLENWIKLWNSENTTDGKT